MIKKFFWRIFLYLLGMLILSLGVVLNSKASLGVSAIISVGYCISIIGNFNFGNVTLIWYGIFVVAQILIHLFVLPVSNKKQTLFFDVMQFPVCIFFTRFINVFMDSIPLLDHNIVLQVVMMFLGIILTGVGAVLALDMRLAPNPADGIVQTLADLFGKRVGFMKNCFDAICVIGTIVIGLVATGKVVGVGVGTFFAVIGVGRVMALFNHLFLDKLKRIAE